MLGAALGGAVSGLALLFIHIGPAGLHQLPVLPIAAIGLNGLFANAAQTTMFALAAHVYPTRIRATGVACAAALGRCGGILSSLGGAAMIQAGGGVFFAVMALAMGVTFVGLSIVRNHYPARHA